MDKWIILYINSKAEQWSVNALFHDFDAFYTLFFYKNHTFIPEPRDSLKY